MLMHLGFTMWYVMPDPPTDVLVLRFCISDQGRRNKFNGPNNLKKGKKQIFLFSRAESLHTT